MYTKRRQGTKQYNSVASQCPVISALSVGAFKASPSLLFMKLFGHWRSPGALSVGKWSKTDSDLDKKDDKALAELFSSQRYFPWQLTTLTSDVSNGTLRFNVFTYLH